jgi:uncharacterized protein YicC (UPF0701 family)
MIVSNIESTGLQHTSQLTDVLQSMSLEGLSATVYRVVPTMQAIPDRNTIIEKAKRNALEELRRVLEALVAARGKGGNEMLLEIEDDYVDMGQLSRECDEILPEIEDDYVDMGRLTQEA